MIKTPLPDDVFARWLKKQDSKKIEKSFGRKANEISAMEVVGKEIHKSPAIIFRTETGAKTVSVKDKNNTESYKKLEKQKFHKFGSAKIDPNDWKGDETVYLYDQVKEQKCNRCGGTGAENCKQCEGKGKHTCENCKKEKKLRCGNCDGKGKIELEVEVYDEKNKKDKLKRQVNCPECHGKAKFVCPDCGDSKITGCSKCKGTGGKSCKQCEGTGVEYLMPIAPVPFKGSSDIHWHWNESIEKQMNKSQMLKNTDLIDLLAKSNVQAIKVSKIKDLDQKFLEEQLGFWDKEASSQVKNAKKDFESMEKDKKSKPFFPIEIYPLQKIDIDTYKNKKFSIYSIGSDKGYIVFDLGF